MKKKFNPKDRIGLDKVPILSQPPASIIYEALGMWDGATKYGRYNWRKNKVVASIYVDAALRHLLAWFDREEFASDSGVPHIGHAKACLGILADAIETGNLVDDRPPKGSAGPLLKRWQRRKKK
jgi:hypothetical protein